MKYIRFLKITFWNRVYYCLWYLICIQKDALITPIKNLIHCPLWKKGKKGWRQPNFGANLNLVKMLLQWIGLQKPTILGRTWWLSVANDPPCNTVPELFMRGIHKYLVWGISEMILLDIMKQRFLQKCQIKIDFSLIKVTNILLFDWFI